MLKTNAICQVAITMLVSLLMVTTGCTSIRSFEGSGLEKLKPGELVTVYETSGRVTKLYLSIITDKEIIGQYQPGGQTVSIPRNNIESIEVARTDYAKSAVAGIGGAVVMVAAVLTMGVVAIAAAASK